MSFAILGTQIAISEYFTPSQAFTGMSVCVTSFGYLPRTAAKHCTLEVPHPLHQPSLGWLACTQTTEDI